MTRLIDAEWVIDFIGSNYNSMRTHDQQGNELQLDAITYSLTVHDLLSAFAYTSIKPVAYRYKEDGYWVYTEIHKDEFNSQALYTSPPKSEWRGLSDEEINNLAYQSHNDTEGIFQGHTTQEQYFGRLLEAKLKEVNGYD